MTGVPGVGLESPFHAIGLAHLGLALAMTALAAIQPRRAALLLALTILVAAALLLAARWSGPLWGETDASFARGFFRQFLLALLFPVVVTAAVLAWLRRRVPSPRPIARAALAAGAYLGALVASMPFSFNVAIVESLMRR